MTADQKRASLRRRAKAVVNEDRARRRYEEALKAWDADTMNRTNAQSWQRLLDARIALENARIELRNPDFWIA